MISFCVCGGRKRKAIPKLGASSLFPCELVVPTPELTNWKPCIWKLIDLPTQSTGCHHSMRYVCNRDRLPSSVMTKSISLFAFKATPSAFLTVLISPSSNQSNSKLWAGLSVLSQKKHRLARITGQPKTVPSAVSRKPGYIETYIILRLGDKSHVRKQPCNRQDLIQRGRKLDQ